MQLTLIELLFKGVPEGILTVLAMHFICNKPIKAKKIGMISIIFIMEIYAIRLLPINMGFHTIITMFIIILLGHTMLNIEIFQATKAMIGITIMILISEGINMVVLTILLGDKIQQVLDNPQIKIMYTIPSTACFGLCILGLYWRSKKRTVSKINKVG